MTFDFIVKMGRTNKDDGCAHSIPLNRVRDILHSWSFHGRTRINTRVLEPYVDPPIFAEMVRHVEKGTIHTYMLSTEFLEWAVANGMVDYKIWIVALDIRNRDSIMPCIQRLRDFGVPLPTSTDGNIYEGLLTYFHPEAISFFYHEMGVPFVDKRWILDVALSVEYVEDIDPTRVRIDYTSSELRHIFAVAEFLRTECGLIASTLFECTGRPMDLFGGEPNRPGYPETLQATRLMYLHDICGLAVPSCCWELLPEYDAYVGQSLYPKEMAKLLVRLGCPFPDDMTKIFGTIQWSGGESSLFMCEVVDALVEAGVDVPADLTNPGTRTGWLSTAYRWR